MAFSMGLPEGAVSKEATLAHCAQIVSATNLPVSADLERGFGDSPDVVAQTILDAASIGLAGCSIEDHTGDTSKPIYDFGLAVERIAAAVQCAHSLPCKFVLTARCESLLWGETKFDRLINRLLAFEEAGADVLFAPGIRDVSAIRTLCSALTKPVNVVVETVSTIGLFELANAGVKRVSTGSRLACAAYSSLIVAAKEMQGAGTFAFSESALTFDEVASYFVER